MIVSILSTSSSTSPSSSARFHLQFLFNAHVAPLQKWSRKLPDGLNHVWWFLLPNAVADQGVRRVEVELAQGHRAIGLDRLGADAE